MSNTDTLPAFPPPQQPDALRGQTPMVLMAIAAIMAIVLVNGTFSAGSLSVPVRKQLPTSETSLPAARIAATAAAAQRDRPGPLLETTCAAAQPAKAETGCAPTPPR